jgi:ATP-dependent RNA circularization protein (DNA/RNA ligase family)
MTHISSYPTVYQVGHKAIQNLFDGEVIIEEKIDGSQFSFGILEGELVCRSKGKQLIIDAPEKMFVKAVENVRSIEKLLHPGWTYRGEYLQSPKHNTLAYDRVPKLNIILYDIMKEVPEDYLSCEEKEVAADIIGLQIAPILYQGVVIDFEMFTKFLDRTSILGGQKIEGVVIKNYSQFTMEKKPAFGKYVSEAYKEVHDKDWKERNPTGKDITAKIILRYKTEARWNKAIQHLRDAGNFDGSPKDIGNLIKEVSQDIHKECQDEIKEILFAHFWKNISRGITAGLPEWYKEELAKKAFE